MRDVDEYIKYVPSKRQMMVQRNGFNVFFHYGLNTFTGSEWGDGKVDPGVFNPASQNTDQWVQAVAGAGAKGVILTCKHHDGFCLWPTKTTPYNISATPYKNGQGDVVKEVSDSCRKYGINFGIYLSPWDRNHKDYSTPKYNDIFCEQLTELLTNYGDIYCVWFDGACGAYMDGKQKQEYDFDRFYELVYKLQPMANISNCGPDIRWVGNEGGFARESEWNVVPKFQFDIQTIEKNSQQSDDGKFAKKGADVVFSDLGSREFLEGFDEFIWYPSEVDVSIRPGWFYHKSQDNAVRSLNNLLNIYYKSVGGNSLLLLNLPPDRRGLIHENDVAVMKSLGDWLKRDETQLLKIAEITAPECEDDHVIQNVLDSTYDKTTFEANSYYTPKNVSESYEINITLDGKKTINRVKLVENVAFSQRVEKFTIFANVGNKFKQIYSGTTIGFGRIAFFKNVTTDKIKIVFESVRNKPYLEFIGVYETNNFQLKEQKFAKIKRYFHQLYYKKFIEKENKKYT